MEFRNTVSILHENSQEISKLIERIGETEEISTIELDILLGKLRDMYDILTGIRVEKTSVQSIKQIETDETPVEEAATEEKEEEILVEEEQEENLHEIELETIAEEDTLGLENEEQNDERDDEPIIEPELFKTEQAYISDQFTAKEKILNEEISPSPEKTDLSSQLTGSPIKSIAGAIGINDKFELVSELFEGSVENFDACIEKLNQAGSFEDAYNYLHETFSWDMENPYVQRILELVRRKLIVGSDER